MTENTLLGLFYKIPFLSADVRSFYYIFTVQLLLAGFHISVIEFFIANYRIAMDTSLAKLVHF